MDNTHNKLINAAAKKVLSPAGLFKVGSSRTWIDDNDYFLTFVEFQPRSGDKGSYLNVGICFMWENTEDLFETLSFDIGGRVNNYPYFISYNGNDETFSDKMEKLADIALQKVKKYRLFQDMNYAKTQMQLQILKNIPFGEMYNLAMLCFLKGDFKDGKKYFNYFLVILKNSINYNGIRIEWKEKLYNHCINYIYHELETKETAQAMVLNMIKRRRNFFSSKSSYKKMKKD